MKTPTLFAFLSMMFIATQALAANTTYVCTSAQMEQRKATFTVLIESGTESGVGEIFLSSPNENGRLGWAAGNNIGNQTLCKQYSIPGGYFTMTEAIAADSFAFAFPDGIFSSPVRAFSLPYIIDADSDGHGCSTDVLTCVPSSQQK